VKLSCPNSAPLVDVLVVLVLALAEELAADLRRRDVISFLG
jgi:hypothetical protein